MKAVTITARRVAYGAGIGALLVSLYGCAAQQMYAHVESTTEAAISAEDVEQVPIQGQSARERAAENARDCRSPVGARIECDTAGILRTGLEEGIPNVWRN